MRHRYETDAIVIGRSSLGEESALLVLLTSDLGLVRARAQSVRRSGAKLASALTTLSESRVTLVRGKEGWRIAGAVHAHSWLLRLADASRAARFCGLLLRLVGSDSRDHDLFPLMKCYLSALVKVPAEHHEALEILAALHLLEQLGLCAQVLSPDNSFSAEHIQAVEDDRKRFLALVNEGIAASGL